jgi:D-amino peptidase
MTRKFLRRCVAALLLAAVCALPAWPQGQTRPSKKVFVITDLEGVNNIFDFDLQCVPQKSPRYAESQQLLTDEVNAAVAGLVDGGATKVIVYDGHFGGHNILPFKLNPMAQLQLLAGSPISPTLGLDASYAAIAFIGLHSMAGTRDGILPHSFTWDIQNIWVNGRKVGEIGARVMLAGSYGIPAIMLSGDAAACDEYRALVPNGECAAVKRGVSHTAGFTLSPLAADNLIHEKAQLAMQRLPQIKPYRITGTVEVKVEYTTPATPTFLPRPGVQQLDGRTWVFHGKDLLDAWVKFRSF